MPVQSMMLRLLTALAVWLLPAVARAQSAAEAEHPRVERIRFEGADALDDSDLRGAIATEQTRCRGFLLRPFCAITDWKILHARRFLDRDELRADVLRLRIYYFQRGYRRATTAAEVRPRDRGVEVVFSIVEGPPTTITSRTVEQTRDVLSARQIRRADLPQEGEPLDLLRLSSGIVRLNDRMGRHGHLDGEVHDSVDFSADTLQADLRVVIDPGPRSTLAGLNIEGNDDVSDRTIGEALRLGTGRVLRSNDVVASQRSLYESNLFHEARVEVPEQQDSAKFLDITVREAPPRAGRAGVGLSTHEFVQTEARITHYNFLGRGRRLDVRGTVGNLLAGQLGGRGFFRDVREDDFGLREPEAFMRPTWLASAEFMQPAFRSAANVVGVNVFTHRRIIPGIVIDEGFGGELSFTRRYGYRTPATLSYRYELISLEAGDLYFCVNYGICELPTVEALHERHRLSPARLGFFSDNANDPLAPSSGYRLRLDAEHASSATMADFHYNRISTEVTGYYPLDVHRRRVLAGRLRGGWVAPLATTGAALGLDDEFARMLHPRKRFYAGGARSVRGYRENQLGPRVLTIDPAVLMEEAGCSAAEIAAAECDPAGVPVDEFATRASGGRNVIEASVEYRFPIRQTLQGAVFVDGARVGESLGGLFSAAAGAVTPGFGVRYASPVGPIRIDLGIRPGRVEDLPVITEAVGDDGLRRLVRLETLRRYDPLEDTSGFFGRALNRLTLHLSIGEAF
jgi:outer membrane protein assembly factor BamA